MNNRNYTIDLIRIIACWLIVWNHLTGGLLDGAYNKWLWANIGVQIFFFMSGYLYGDRCVQDKKEWLKKQLRKIYTPYWIYITLFIPVVYYLSTSFITVTNCIVAYIGLQGLVPGEQIEGFGQHWFVLY